VPGPTSTTPLGVQDATGKRAVSSVTPNTRVKASSGFLATVADQLLFPDPPGPSTFGIWLVGDARVRVCGIPSVSVGSIGLSFKSPSLPPVGPLTVVQPDPRVESK
jgi:hypothetical protein